MMKLVMVIPIRLGQYGAISSEDAKALIGEPFSVRRNSINKDVGTGVIEDVEWRDSNDIILTVKLDVSDGLQD